MERGGRAAAPLTDRAGAPYYCAMRPRGALLLALLASCQAERITTTPFPTVSFDAHAWSGGTLQLVSGGFESSDSIHIFVAGTRLQVQRLDSVTLVASLPDTTGTFDVRVETAGRVHPAGSVTLHGAVLSSRTEPHPEETAIAWPYGAGTFLAGVGGRLVRVDVSDGTLTPVFADSLFASICGYGPWPAGNDAIVLAGPVPGRAPNAYDYCRLRALRSDGQVLDSFPLWDQSRWGPAIRLPDGSWVVTRNVFGTDVFRRPPGDSLLYVGTVPLYEPWRVAVSPDGRYITAASGFGGTDGLPIISGEQLASPAFVPEVGRSQAAAFSGSGDTLAVQRASTAAPDSVFLLASRTGAVLAAVAAVTEYTDLAFDPGHPWLYAASGDSGGVGVSVAVYDLRTLRVATVLHAAGLSGGLYHNELYLSVDVARRRLNVLLTGVSHSAAPAVGLSFDLLP